MQFCVTIIITKKVTKKRVCRRRVEIGMSNTKEYKNEMAFHPGYYIAEIIEEMELSQAEFAARLGTTGKTLSKLLNGKANITSDLAKKLSVMMGTSANLWLNLQNTYDQKLIEIQNEKDFKEQKEIMKQIDYKYFVEVAKLPEVRPVEEKIRHMCDYLKVSDLRIMERPDFLVCFGNNDSGNSKKKEINARAWIQTAMNVAKSTDAKPYNAEKLKGFLTEFRSMTMKKPDDFSPRMKNYFAECGVIFVLLPYLKNSGINGAVKWASGERAVLAMNSKGLGTDRFWFLLFHEIKHVLQHKTKTVFIDSTEKEMAENNDPFEIEADRFASNMLIPPKKWKRFAPTKDTKDSEIVEFAESIGINPMIVAGRLRCEKIIPTGRYSKLKETYEIDFEHYC